MLLCHPEVPTCPACMKWAHDPGQRWRPVTHRGKPMPRAAGDEPCKVCPRVPAGATAKPASGVNLSARNLMAYQHYKECRAVGRFPDDPLVSYQAAIIRDAEDEADRLRGQAVNVMAAVATKGK